MCFYSEPEVVAIVLEEAARMIRKMAKKDEDVTEEDVRKLGCQLEKVDFEIRGCIRSHEEADLDAVSHSFI